MKKTIAIFNKIKTSLLLSGFLLACTPSTPKKVQIVSLPSLPQIITLQVKQVVNPRFPSLSHAQLAQTLQKAQSKIKQQFNLNVKFVLTDKIDIEKFFSGLSDKVIRAKKRDIIKFSDGISEEEFANIVESIETELQSRDIVLEDLYQYSRAYLTKSIQQLSYKSLAQALASTLVHRLETWQSIKAKDGEPILNQTPYNEWVWWDVIGYSKINVDLIMTNQLVASVETYGMDAHSALRGGITNGTTTYSQDSVYKSYAFVSSFSVLNNNPVLAQLRQQETISDEEKTDYLALMIAHEMGHLLLHYGHPYNKPECIMSPMPLLNYQVWQAQLNAKKCKLGGYQSMTVGHIKLRYQQQFMHKEE